FPGSESQSRNLQAAARKLGLQLHVVHASTERDFDPIFAAMVQLRAGMLVIGADPFFFGHRDQIAALAIRHRMPAIFFLREFATVGGLMSYGPRSSTLRPPKPWALRCRRRCSPAPTR